MIVAATTTDRGNFTKRLFRRNHAVLGRRSHSWLKPYSIVNFRIGATLFDNYDVSFYANNLFNKATFSSVSPASYAATQGGTAGGYTAAPNDPRVVGVTLRAKW